MRSNLALAGALVLVGLGACSAHGPTSKRPGDDMERGLTPGMGRPLGRGPTTTTMLGLGHLPDSLSAEQRAQVDIIVLDLGHRQAALMQQMNRRAALRAEGAAPMDEQAERREIDTQARLHRALLDNTIEARRQVEALLTPEQREEWRRAREGRR